MTGLKKHGTRRFCRNCGIDPKERGKNPACRYCTKHKKAVNNWRPDLETCKSIVLFYIKQRSHISATEMAEHAEIPLDVILGAIAQLVKDGVLKTETSVVIVE